MARRTLTKARTSDLQAELKRRQQRLPALKRRQANLTAELVELGEQIKALGGGVSAARKKRAAPARRRPKNKMSLADALAKALKKDKPMTVGEAIAGVKKLGYRSSSTNFRMIVNQTLVKDKRFNRRGRGNHTLASPLG